MSIIFKDHEYQPDIDILCRVYKNQGEDFPEEEQICSEVLFKPHLNMEHSRAVSWLPNGAVTHIVKEINNIKGDYIIQISNELDDNIGVLTSCRENFINSRVWEELKYDLTGLK